MKYNDLAEKYEDIVSYVDYKTEDYIFFKNEVITEQGVKALWLARLYLDRDGINNLFFDGIEFNSIMDSYGYCEPMFLHEDDAKLSHDDFISFYNALKIDLNNLTLNTKRFSTYLIDNSYDLDVIIKNLPENLNDQDDYGGTPLIDAIKAENIRLISYLIEHNVECDQSVVELAKGGKIRAIGEILEIYYQKLTLEALCEDDDRISVSL